MSNPHYGVGAELSRKIRGPISIVRCHRCKKKIHMTRSILRAAEQIAVAAGAEYFNICNACGVVVLADAGKAICASPPSVVCDLHDMMRAADKRNAERN